MVQLNGFEITHAVLRRPQQLCFILAHLARAAGVCTCIVPWVFVCVVMFIDRPLLALAIVAASAALVCIPLYVITNAQIRVQRPIPHHVVAHD